MSKKCRRNNLSVIITAIIFFLCIGIAIFWKMKQIPNMSNSEILIPQSNVSITLKDCDDTIDPWKQEDLGVKGSKWLDDNTLFIKTHIRMLCGGESISKASYSLQDTELTLSYSTKRGDQITRCVCAKELDYTISDLSQKEYSISVKGE